MVDEKKDNNTILGNLKSGENKPLELAVLVDEVYNSFTFARINSFQEYNYLAQRANNTDFINFRTIRDIKQDQPHLFILQIASALYKGGTKDVPSSSDELTSRLHELFLVLQNRANFSSIYCGGYIEKDPAGRYNPIYIQLKFSDKSLAEKVFEAIKTEPNTTLEAIMYRIFKSPEGKPYLPTARTYTSGYQHKMINPFIHPIQKVTSGIIK